MTAYFDHAALAHLPPGAFRLETVAGHPVARHENGCLYVVPCDAEPAA